MGAAERMDEGWPSYVLPEVNSILQRHFHRRESHTAAALHSTFGAMLERMRVLGCSSEPCQRCTSGIARDGSACPFCYGTGFTETRHVGRSRMDSNDVCTRCNGSGRYRRKRYAIMTRTPDGLKRHGLAVNQNWKTQRLDELACCTACRGTGRVENLTAASSAHAPQYIPQQPDEPHVDPTLDHVLTTLRDSDPQAAAALERMHGPASASLVDHPWGRAAILWPDTPSARRIAGARHTEPTMRLLARLLREQAAGEIDDLTAALLDRSRLEVEGAAQHARAALYRADASLGSPLLRRAQKEALR